jgi:hypothetical protein
MDGNAVNVNVNVVLPRSLAECNNVSEDPAVCVSLLEDGEITSYQNIGNDLQTATVMSEKTASNIQSIR